MSDEFLFGDDNLVEDAGAAAGAPVPAEPWLILIVDDDLAIHATTKMVLRGLAFDGRPAQFLSASTAAEARTLLERNAEIAVVLLDVVMESDDAGLRLVRFIRSDLNNRRVRIILRTGQPSQAPERDVILNYDINDYKSKTELTAQKLFTSVIAALRGFQDITAIAEHDASMEALLQVPAAFQFKQEGGRIGVAPPLPPEDPATAQLYLNDLRERAETASERLGRTDAATVLATEVTRLRDYLPSAVTDLSPHMLRIRLITIDAAVATLQSAGAARELSDDATMQVTALGFAGRELLLCYPDLRSRERESIARAIPYGQEQSIAEALAVDAKAASEAPAVVTEEAAAALDAISAMASEAIEGPVEAQRERVVELVVVNRNFRSEVVRFGWELWDRVNPGVLDGAGSVSKHAVVFGFAGLVGALTTPALGIGAPVVGIAALFAGYGQIDRALKLLEEHFSKKAKEIKDDKDKT